MSIPSAGIDVRGSSTNTAYGGGGGVVFRLGSGLQADLGAVALYFPPDEGIESLTTATARMGLGLALP